MTERAGPNLVRLAAVRTAALVFVVGGIAAAVELWSRPHVREFQTGPPSAWLERASAWIQRTAYESLGFGFTAAVIAVIAVALARSDARRAFGLCWCGAGALWAFARHGTYLGEEFIRFLQPFELFVFDVLGFGLLFAAAASGAWVARRLPYGRTADAAWTGFAAGLIMALGSDLWRDAVRGPGGGLVSTASIATLFAVAAAVPLLSAPLGRLAAALTSVLLRPTWRTRWSSAERFAVPVFLLSCGAVALVLGRATTPTVEPTYERLTSTRAPTDDGPRRVVLILIDTLRADALGCYGYERDTSPAMDALAERGTVFEDVTSSASWTKPATATLLTGLYPSRHGALHHGSSLRTPDGHETMAEAFKKAGFATAGFVSNPNVKAIFDFDRGFDTYFDAPVEDTVSAAALRDSYFGRMLVGLLRYQFNWNYENDVFRMNRHVESWLRTNADQDYFLYIHYIDPHTPYAPPERWRKAFEQDHPGFPLHNERRRLVGRDLYDAEVRTTDEGLEQLFDTMRELDVFNDALIAITSDHGEEFDEHGLFEHGFSLYQAEVFVPLILHGPDVAAQRVAAPINTVHVPATLLELARVRAPSQGEEVRFGDGLSVAEAVRGGVHWTPNPSFIENEFNMSQSRDPDFVLRGLRDGPYKLVLTLQSRYRPISRFPSQELFDISKDPGERVNLFDLPEQAERTEQMLERLSAHWSFLESQGLRGGATVELTDEMRRELQRLGYLLEDE